MQYLRSVWRRLLFSAAIALALGCASSSGRTEEKHIRELRAKTLSAAVHVGGGTGWAVWHDSERVLLITAGHVIEGETVVYVTSYVDGAFRSCSGVVIARSIRGVDLGLVLIPKPAFEFEELPIATDAEYDTVKPGDVVMAAG